MVEIKTAGFSPADFKALAALHIDSIPRTSFSLIGPDAAALAYRCMAASSRETVAAAMKNNVVCGGLVISHDPATLIRRILVQYPLQFCARAAFPLLRRITRLPEVCSLLAGSAAPYAFTPELMFLYADPAMRGQGIGTMLLESVLPLLAANVPTLYVRTLDEEGNRALGFYRKNGFREVEVVEYLGKRQAVMARALHPLFP